MAKEDKTDKHSLWQAGQPYRHYQSWWYFCSMIFPSRNEKYPTNLCQVVSIYNGYMMGIILDKLNYDTVYRMVWVCQWLVVAKKLYSHLPILYIVHHLIHPILHHRYISLFCTLFGVVCHNTSLRIEFVIIQHVSL